MSARGRRLWPWILIPVVGLTAVLAVAVVGFLTFGTASRWPWWGFFPWFPFVGIWIVFGFLFLFGVFRGPWGPWGWGYREDYPTGDRSAAILRERYARGGITREQFDRMRQDLDGHLMANAYGAEPGREGSP